MTLAMDFLDPKKQRNYKIRLIVGYGLITIAVLLTVTVLLYQAYGFGLDKNGNIIQNGLVFVSSTPSGAQISINNSRYKSNTNVRIPLPSGQYTIKLQRTGYIDWKRAITVEGGIVEHFDYPVLFPLKMQTTAIKSYDFKPRLVTQSPDRHWALVQANEAPSRFEVSDLTQPKLAANEITLPDTVLSVTQAGTLDGWELAQWSTDNRHVVLRHTFTKNGEATYEYILVDRSDPSQSINLTTTWGTNPTAVELRNDKYDQYYLFDKTAATLSTASLKVPAPVVYLDHVLAYKSYGSNIMLYVTDKAAPAGKAFLEWHQDDGTNYTLRTLTASQQYLVNLTQYSGDWFVAASDLSDGKVYIYKNPVDMLNAQHLIVPAYILKVPHASFLDFSDNARFILAEDGSHFGIYDAENSKGYAYDAKLLLDAPQPHAQWMDGNHIGYVSANKVVVFDFDNANQVTLGAANALYQPMFNTDYKYLYTVGAGADVAKPAALDQTALRTAQDL